MDKTSVSIGITVGFAVLGGLLLACLIKHLWGKIKCPKCKRKKPSMKDKVLEKVGVQSKSKSKTFSISNIVEKK
ncbi:hypothetical protein AALO_G00204540 [Alosa alosa]|uniref:Uncharacterized protein n=1 Tax=Alosa alosa TaxID=278164 RepID=A0AAV6G3F6_9TELE|nr:hypothetical protein AALO_G00204540 [Alosa alosa]